MTCPQCQAMNEAGDAFCRNCGSPLTQVPGTHDSSAQSGPTPTTPQVGAPYQQQQQADEQQQPLQQQPHQAGPVGQSPYQPPFTQPGPGPQTPAFSFDLQRLSPIERVVGAASIVALISLFLPWFGVFGFTVSGVGWHGYLYLELIVALLIIAYLVMCCGWDQLPFALPVARGPLLIIGVSVQFLLVLIGFLDKPSGTSWQIGAYLALIAALAAAVPVIAPAVKSFQASR